MRCGYKPPRAHDRELALLANVRRIQARHQGRYGSLIGATPSMSRTGNCYDNAPMESFFHTLKVELVHQCRWATLAQARQTLLG